MDRPSFLRAQSFREPVRLAVLLLTALLAAKFLLPLFRFPYPLGYDAGIYRYLFLTYAPFWPPFTLPALPEWALEHPVGLFLFSTPLLKLGIPVDWLVGWVWNLFPVALALMLAWVMAKRHGRDIAPWVLVCALCSAAYFDGFAAMYWKTFASLLFLILTFHFTERLSLWALPFALLTFVTHHQTGLILGLVLVSWWIMSVPTHWRNRKWRVGTLGIIAVAGISLLLYLPQWNRAVMGPLVSIFRLQGDSAPAGAFPDAFFYLRTSGLLLALGIGGLVFTLRQRKEWYSMWFFAVVWCAVFVVFRLVFYRRFFLQLDFFLLPFAALGARALWQLLRRKKREWILMLLFAAQLIVSWQASLRRVPITSDETFAQVAALESHLDPGDFVLGLENQSAMVLRGWLPEQEVAGPGLFGFPWTYEQWETFLLGTHEEKAMMAAHLPDGAYVYASLGFFGHYGQYAVQFLADSCFHQTQAHGLYLVDCPAMP